MVGATSQVLSPEARQAPDVSPAYTAAFQTGMLSYGKASHQPQESLSPVQPIREVWTAWTGAAPITSIAYSSLVASTQRKPCRGLEQREETGSAIHPSIPQCHHLWVTLEAEGCHLLPCLQLGSSVPVSFHQSHFLNLLTLEQLQSVSAGRLPGRRSVL